jgi:hypothetical protein
MSTTIPFSSGFSGKILLTRILLACGILSSLLYIAMNIFIPAGYEGYNSTNQVISELSAIGAPTRSVWVAFGFPCTLLVAAFGWGIIRSADGNRLLRIAGVLLCIYGIVGLAWPLFPMHQGTVLAAGGGTWSDTMHIVFSFVSVLLMMMAMGWGAAASGRTFRIYTIVSMLLLLGLGTLTGIYAPRLNANQSTPWLGLYERIMIDVFLLWVMVLAIKLWRRESHQSTTGS